jgi:ornithine cyclodeaminase
MMNKSPVPFSIVTGKTIFRLVQEDLGGCIDVVRNAYLAHANGSSINPHGVFLRFPDRTNARIIALPSRKVGIRPGRSARRKSCH